MHKNKVDKTKHDIGVVLTSDFNPGPTFTIPGFGIEKFMIPDPGRITQLAIILANSTKVDKIAKACLLFQ